MIRMTAADGTHMSRVRLHMRVERQSGPRGGEGEGVGKAGGHTDCAEVSILLRDAG